MAGVPCDARRQGRAAELAALPAVAALRQPRRVGSRSGLRAPTPPPALLGCADSPHHPAARRLTAHCCPLGGSSAEACCGLCLAAVGGGVYRHGGRHPPVSAQGIRTKVFLDEFRRFRRGERRSRAVRGAQVVSLMAVAEARQLFEAGSRDHLACALLIESRRAAPETAGRGTDRA